MKITVYTITDCQFSKQEKEYLASHNLQFEEKNLETDKAFLTEMLAVSNNFAGTPVTKIEKDNGQSVVLKGFTKEEFDKELGFSGEPATPAPVAEPKKEEAPAAPAVSAPTPAAAPDMTMPPMPAAPTPEAAAPAPAVPAAPTMPDMTMPAAPAPEPVAPAPVAPAPTAPAMPQAPVAPAAPAPVAPAPSAAPQQFQNDPSIDALLNDLQKKAAEQSAPAQNAPQAPAAPPAPGGGMPAIPDFGDQK